MKGQFSVEYTANETPMTSYLNTHLALEQLRQKMKKEKELGPRVLVIGPHDVGKTSLCKILMSYSLRQGGTPIYVSLDTSEVSDQIRSLKEKEYSSLAQRDLLRCQVLLLQPVSIISLM